jgi:alpha-L-rhamnosidase
VPHRFGRRPADPAWGAAYPLLVWYMYQYQGDRRIVEEHYAGVKAWTDFLTTRAKDGVLEYFYYADWVPVEKTPGNLVSTFYYCYSAQLVAKMAEVLGRSADAESYRKLAAAVGEAFNRRFLNRDGVYGNGTQTSNLLPFYLGIAPKEGASWKMRDDIVYQHDTHLSTGIVGTKYIMEYLTRTGNSDLAYDLATQTTYPSWGYMIENGATTLWELWQNKTGPSMNSHNHPMFGSVGAWFYYALAGINLDPAHPGYERIRIEPQVVRDLKWASGSIDTLRGTVASSWRRLDDGLRLEVAIPVGSVAEVRLPKGEWRDAVIRESGREVWKNGNLQAGVPGVYSGKEEDGAVLLDVGSGNYEFQLTGN